MASNPFASVTPSLPAASGSCPSQGSLLWGPLTFLPGPPAPSCRPGLCSGLPSVRVASWLSPRAPRCLDPADVVKDFLVTIPLVTTLCLQISVSQVNLGEVGPSSRCLQMSGCLSLPRNIWMAAVSCRFLFPALAQTQPWVRLPWIRRSKQPKWGGCVTEIQPQGSSG